MSEIEFVPSEIIEKGHVAPFTGVLVPEETYRDYQSQIGQFHALKNVRCQAAPLSPWDVALVGFIGLSLGLLVQR